MSSQLNADDRTAIMTNIEPHQLNAHCGAPLSFCALVLFGHPRVYLCADPSVVSPFASSSPLEPRDPRFAFPAIAANPEFFNHITLTPGWSIFNGFWSLELEPVINRGISEFQCQPRIHSLLFLTPPPPTASAFVRHYLWTVIKLGNIPGVLLCVGGMGLLPVFIRSLLLHVQTKPLKSP